MIAAAIYARKSTDAHVTDEAKSVTRQIEHAKAYAVTQGWTVLDDHVYVDDGISGAEFAARPGFVRLMAALSPRAPFGALVMSEASRLGREQFETGFTLKRLSQAGVRCFSYLDAREIALDTATEKFMMSAATFGADLEREKARQRTADALTRKARAGHLSGSLCFGYDKREVTGPDGQRSHVERVINDAEAAIVRMIFERSVEGHGFSRIARDLNEEDAPCPRPLRGGPAGWAPTSIRSILMRPLYRGEAVYGMTKKRDSWGQQKVSKRPQSEWIRAAVPALRIVSDDLWYAAQTRLSRVRTSLGTAGRPRRHRDIESPYLLPGFARCALCGGSFAVLNRTTLGCATFHRRGAKACANNVTLSITRIDEALHATLATDVLRPAVITALLDAVFAELQPTTVARDLRALRTQLRALDTKIANLTAAVENGAALAPLVAQLTARQTERNTLVTAIGGAEAVAQTQLDRPAITRAVLARAQTWRTRLMAGTSEARQLFREVLAGPIQFTPEGRRYRFEGELSADRLLTGAVAAPLHHLVCARQELNLRPPA